MSENKLEDTLLTMASGNLRAAKHLLTSEDEIFINYASYHLQQCIELALKHILEMCGVNYPKTHDISTLVQSVESLSVLADDLVDELYDRAAMISFMETRTRYIKNYRESMRNVKNVMLLAERLIDACSTIRVKPKTNCNTHSSLRPLTFE